jgi:hypothetical protein
MRSAQGIGWSAAETDCGTGCPSLGYLSWTSKKGNSPIGETLWHRIIFVEKLNYGFALLGELLLFACPKKK